MGSEMCIRDRCLPLEMRPTDEEKKSGWKAPTLTSEQQMEHENRVIPHDLAAISVGLIEGDVYLDLDYVLDSNADVDMNVVKTADCKYVELQGTVEESTFSGEELSALIALADAGLDGLFEVQAAILDGIN